MKKVFTMLLCFVTIVSICGCKSSNDKAVKESIKVGITMYNEFDPFTEDIRHNIEEYLIEYQTRYGVEISTSVVYSGKNQLLQNDQVQDFIDKDYDVICVNLVDRTDPSVIIEAAKAADKPIIFFNRELVEDDLKRFDKLYYVGARPEESGKLQGRIIVEALRERMDEIDLNQDGIIQYVMLEGEPGHQDAIVRSRVSVETITGCGIKLERLGDEIANWDRQQAQTKITSLLAGYPRQIELIIANDDNMALGAVDALTNFGVQTMPLIVGVNGQEEALEMVNEGMIEGTVLNNSKEKGKIIAKLALFLGVDGKPPKDLPLVDGKYYYISYELINKKNINDYFTEEN